MKFEERKIEREKERDRERGERWSQLSETVINRKKVLIDGKGLGKRF